MASRKRTYVFGCLERLESRYLLAASEPPAATPRHAIDWLPTTVDGRVHAFSDQLPISSFSDSQVRFAATHFVGSQKQTAAEIARLRAIDPDFALLQYRLATASGGNPFILDTGTWGSDWPTVTAHEDWFEHSIVEASRLHNVANAWDLHDITNPAFQRYWIDSTIAAMRATGAQGTFADSFTAGIGGLLGQATGDPRFDGTGAKTGPWSGPNWLDRLSSLVTSVTAAYRATAEGFLYMPNIGPLTTSWANVDLSGIDGGMLELFAMDAPGYHADAAEYAAAMDRALALSRAGKPLIMQPGLVGGLEGSHRGFLVGTYYLLAGDRTYINIVDGDAVGMYWYPEYGIDLGAPLSTTAASMRDYDVVDGVVDQVYRRDFAAGRVIVNGADVPRTVNLGAGTFTRVRGIGGGAVAAGQIAVDGTYTGGTLVRTSVSGPVTLAPGESLILVGPPSVAAVPPVAAFPSAGLPAVQVGALPTGYETSGLAWHERLRRLLAVSDSGIVTSMNLDGSDMINWSVPGDLEGITVADPAGDFIYVGVEHPDSILEINVRTGAVERRFTLTQWMQGPDNQGLEGLTFIPVPGNPEGGVFYAGLQADGRVYTFQLPIVSSRVATDVFFCGAITIDAGLTDVSDLSYDRRSGLLLSLYDSANRLVASTSSGERIAQWQVPGTEQEGILAVEGSIYIGEDYQGGSTGTILRYGPFSLPSIVPPPPPPPPTPTPTPTPTPPPADRVRPRATFQSVVKPSSGPVATVTVTFTEPVTGVTIDDFRLKRGRQEISLARAAVSRVDAVTWTISNLGPLVGTHGTYRITLVALGSGIVDAAGNPLARQNSITWRMTAAAAAAALRR